MGDACNWYKKFDGHYTLDCTDIHGNRANGNFKPYPFNNMGEQPKTKWDFKYCPYCGRIINIIRMTK